MPFIGPYRCPNCSRTWLISDYHVPSRDPDSLHCDCGQEIFSWSGSRQYSAMRLYPNVLILDRDLPTRGGFAIAAGTEIRVTGEYRNPSSRHEPPLRVIRIEDSEYEVLDSALDSAWEPEAFPYPGL